jgi:FtsP/CotA-like multicopper oxidase with cupredoxin domain
VESHGDLAHDTIYSAADQRLAVTELMQPGQTHTLRWVPERAGNWLMHCHMTEHINPKLRRSERPNHDKHSVNHALDVMSGLVLGWRVLPANGSTAADQPIPPARTLRLVAKPARVMHGNQPGLGFILQDDGLPAGNDSVRIPGPPLMLVRGEPVQIRVVNQLAAPTSIHWHGIELESYFDGVSGWSGDAARTSPQVEPGDSFDVQFTPPRAGTFIYHSHWEEERQLGSGMFGPIIVLDRGDVYDPRTDHSWILSQGGWVVGDPILLNGSSSPVMELQAGQKHRIRLINISPTIPLTFQLLADSAPVAWRAIAKDGADLPSTQKRTQPARLQIGVGETYDFEISPEQGQLRVVVLDPVGVVRLRGEVRIRPGS